MILMVAEALSQLSFSLTITPFATAVSIQPGTRLVPAPVSLNHSRNTGTNKQENQDEKRKCIAYKKIQLRT